MGFYGKYILPKMVHFTCSREPHMRQRQKVVPLAKGRVLEIGIGSGLNLPLYDPGKVTQVLGLEPSEAMRRIAVGNTASLNMDIAYIEASAEQIPLDDRSVDTIVVTYALCTIPDVVTAIRDMRRVLKRDGELIFCEHGAAPDERVKRWQDRLNPLWNKIGGGCNLNRIIPALVEQGGFRIKTMEAMYIPGWRPGSFNYWGTAE
jgi:ubiquinone/menaquinone biosynthesis C-methylase UbiE